jgi:hypothetical protein
MKFYKSSLFKITLLANVRQMFPCNSKLPQIPMSCDPNNNNMTQWKRISRKVPFLRINSIHEEMICCAYDELYSVKWSVQQYTVTPILFRS